MGLCGVDYFPGRQRREFDQGGHLLVANGHTSCNASRFADSPDVTREEANNLCYLQQVPVYSG
jgi:hypothetical protein